MKSAALATKIFVTGTDTDVGKTVVSAILTAGLDADYWKPIQCGLAEPTDREWVAKHTRLGSDHFHPETHALQAPLSPHASAKLEGIQIEISDFQLPNIPESRPLVVEGAGGIMVPLNDRQFILDLMVALDLPVVLVARSTLGTINHTLLSLERLQQAGLNVLGVVLNGPVNESNYRAIEHYGRIRIMGHIRQIDKFNPETMKQVYRDQFSFNGWTV